MTGSKSGHNGGQANNGIMSHSTLWAELLAFGAAISLSPLHLAVLLLLLLGPRPLQRGAWFVAGWMVTTLAAVGVLLTVGHSLVLDLTHGSHHRTGLDLLAGGALIALGAKELLGTWIEHDQPPGWTQSIHRFVAMPIPVLVGLGSLTELASPDDLLLFAKAASVVLAADLPIGQELVGMLLFSAAASVLLLVPLMATVISRGQVLPMLEQGKQLLFAHGDRAVGGMSLALGVYLGWQGVSGLMLT
mgnify:CR=1 FL=1